MADGGQTADTEPTAIFTNSNQQTLTDVRAQPDIGTPRGIRRFTTTNTYLQQPNPAAQSGLTSPSWHVRRTQHGCVDGWMDGWVM